MSDYRIGDLIQVDGRWYQIVQPAVGGLRLVQVEEPKPQPESVDKPKDTL